MMPCRVQGGGPPLAPVPATKAVAASEARNFCFAYAFGIDNQGVDICSVFAGVCPCGS